MRKLHPIGPNERPVDEGAWHRPDGAREAWSLHALPGERSALRVAVGRQELWHLVLDEDGRPERLQARVAMDGRPVDATFTFFEDEVLIWRRGADPTSEAIELPPRTRLLWPPYAGRARCLALGTRPAEPTAVMTALLRIRDRSNGGLELRPVRWTLRPAKAPSEPPSGSAWSLETPGLPALRAQLDEDGRALRWWRGQEQATREAPGPGRIVNGAADQ